MRILWDFDGTLFDTYPAYADILLEVLGSSVIREEIEAHLKISFTHAARYYALTDRQQQAIFEMEERLDPERTKPFPHVEALLEQAERNVIVTHKPRAQAIRILRHYNMERYFAEIVVAGDGGFPKKPDPASYAYLHQKHRLDLAIGDREIDIAPAKALGMRTCLFRSQAPGADIYLADYGPSTAERLRASVKTGEAGMRLIEAFARFGDFLQGLGACSDSLWNTPVTEGKWAVRDVVSHLLRWDQYFLEEAIDKIARGEKVTARHLNFDDFNREAVAYGRTMPQEELIRQAVHSRRRIAELIAALPEEELYSEHEDGDGAVFTVWGYLNGFVPHDLQHRLQIERVIAARVDEAKALPDAKANAEGA